jgi:toxin CptA
MAIKPSPRLALLLLLSHALAASAVYATAMPPSAKLAILALVLPSLFYYLARDALLLLPGSWREIIFDQGSLSVVARDGCAFFGKIEGKTTVTPYFVVLRVRQDARRLPVFRIIFPDAMGADEFRELRVRLRFAQ